MILKTVFSPFNRLTRPGSLRKFHETEIFVESDSDVYSQNKTEEML